MNISNDLKVLKLFASINCLLAFHLFLTAIDCLSRKVTIFERHCFLSPELAYLAQIEINIVHVQERKKAVPIKRLSLPQGFGPEAKT